MVIYCMGFIELQRGQGLWKLGCKWLESDVDLFGEVVSVGRVEAR